MEIRILSRSGTHVIKKKKKNGSLKIYFPQKSLKIYKRKCFVVSFDAEVWEIAHTMMDAGSLNRSRCNLQSERGENAFVNCNNNIAKIK